MSGQMTFAEEQAPSKRCKLTKWERFRALGAVGGVD